jgi:hypothetical protein
MPWYAWIYVAYVGAVTVSATRRAVRENDAFGPTVADLAAAACEIAFVVAWSRGLVFPREWFVVAAAVGFTAVWFVAGCVHVARRRQGWGAGLSEAEAARILRHALAFSTIRFARRCWRGSS